MIESDLASDLCVIAQKAGDYIIDVKSKLKQGNFQIKGDGSPVTIADLGAHDIIREGLSKLMPNTPIVSEEGLVGNPLHSDFSFVVDPLDGTKEFIKGNGMYTVNIALARKTKKLRWEPILGVVVAPDLGTTWIGGRGIDATRQYNGSTERILVGSESKLPIVVGSVSHPSPMDGYFLKDIGDHIFEGVGSSIKICRVADGSADLSARFGPTSCWDTAAAHAILNSAGGNLLGPKGKELDYDLVDDQLNPPFIATYDSKWLSVWLKHNP